jgi:regulatory protein
MPPLRGAAARRAAAQERRDRRAQVTDPAVVMEAAAAYLAPRPRTAAQVRAHLRRLGYRDPICGEVLARLAALGYLDDAAFARSWVEGRDRSRPRGEAGLRHELQRLGVAADTIDTVLEERRSRDGEPGSERGEDASPDRLAARRLLERRGSALRREPDPRRRRQRAYALLARSGFDPEVCREESRRVVGADAHEEAAS